ncbi:MAG: efflux RND transporter periplasmic adaptor subunit [bacterium]|nr:efflux RND transporter periplasmic adaptor subunit [bacterium]
MKSTQFLAAGAAVVAFSFAGCMGGGWGGGFSMPPTPVETTTAKVQAVEDRFETIGSIEADEAVTVVAEMGGTITRIPYGEGGSVGKGELLAQIDDREFKAALDRAIALRDQAQTSFDRVKTIVEQNAGSQQAFDDAQAALRVAEANVAFAKAQHDKTRITAPFAGTVGARKVSPGEFVQPGTPITELARLEQLRVAFSVPERYLADLYINAPVRIMTTAFPDMEIMGAVMVVEPQVDMRTRNVGIVARIDNAEGKLRPGMSANIAVTLRSGLRR